MIMKKHEHWIIPAFRRCKPFTRKPISGETYGAAWRVYSETLVSIPLTLTLMHAAHLHGLFTSHKHRVGHQLCLQITRQKSMKAWNGNDIESNRGNNGYVIKYVALIRRLRATQQSTQLLQQLRLLLLLQMSVRCRRKIEPWRLL